MMAKASSSFQTSGSCAAGAAVVDPIHQRITPGAACRSAPASTWDAAQDWAGLADKGIEVLTSITSRDYLSTSANAPVLVTTRGSR
jgi:hypothetical protein